MEKIITQYGLNELLESSVELGKGNSYCPPHQTIIDNWDNSKFTIEGTYLPSQLVRAVDIIPLLSDILTWKVTTVRETNGQMEVFVENEEGIPTSDLVSVSISFNSTNGAIQGPIVLIRAGDTSGSSLISYSGTNPDYNIPVGFTTLIRAISVTPTETDGLIHDVNTNLISFTRPVAYNLGTPYAERTSISNQFEMYIRFLEFVASALTISVELVDTFENRDPEIVGSGVVTIQVGQNQTNSALATSPNLADPAYNGTSTRIVSVTPSSDSTYIYFTG